MPARNPRKPPRFSGIVVSCSGLNACNTKNEDDEITPTFQSLTCSWGVDTATGVSVRQCIQMLSDGTNGGVLYFDEQGNKMTLSGQFTVKAASKTIQESAHFATVTDSSDGDFGKVIPLLKVDTYTDGVLNPTLTKYYDTGVAPNADVTATVTSAPYEIMPKAIRVAMPKEALVVTGAAGVALAAIPAHATYAEIYIDAGAGDANIRWTKDGSEPADANGEQDMSGTTIKLYDRGSIEGFRVIPIDESGEIDGALTANLTVNYWNIDESED